MRDLITLTEAGKKLTLKKLPYSRTALSPVLSKPNIDYHYGKLAKGYVDRFNKGQGDKQFNEAGAFLHNIYFPQLMAPKNANSPSGAVKTLIDKHFGSYIDFKKDIKEQAMSLQGSNWIYLSLSGKIKTIKNHAIRKDICLLIDWWEHAWIGTDKVKYIDNIWRLINWDQVNKRLAGRIQDEY